MRIINFDIDVSSNKVVYAMGKFYMDYHQHMFKVFSSSILYRMKSYYEFVRAYVFLIQPLIMNVKAIVDSKINPQCVYVLTFYTLILLWLKLFFTILHNIINAKRGNMF